MKKKFFANLWLTFHSWSPYQVKQAAALFGTAVCFTYIFTYFILL